MRLRWRWRRERASHRTSCGYAMNMRRLAFCFLLGGVLLAQTSSLSAGWKRGQAPQGIRFRYPDWQAYPQQSGKSFALKLIVEGARDRQTQSCAGDVPDGATLNIRIAALPEGQTRETWARRRIQGYSGDRLRQLPLHQNGFRGVLRLVYAGSGDQSIVERGAAARKLPSGQYILVTWERDNAFQDNSYSYQRYLIPTLQSFRLQK